MKYKMTALLLLCFGMAYAQSGNVHIKGAIAGLKAGEKLYLYDWDNTCRDSALSSRNGFVFDTYIPDGQGSGYRLQIGPRRDLPNTVLYLYLEPGTVELSGQGPLLKDVSLSGSPFAKDMGDYRHFVNDNPVIRMGAALQEKAGRAMMRHDTTVLASLSPGIRGVNAVERALVALWISMHRASPVSAFIIDTHFFYTHIEPQAEAFHELLPAALQNHIGRELARRVGHYEANIAGKPAPAISLPDTSGQMISLSSFRGHYVLLDFWASWCVPCREESPYLREAFQKFGHKNFTILSVSMDTDKGKWLAAIRKDRLSWTHVSGLQPKPESEILSGYYIPTIPSNFLIGPDGVIIARNLRGEALSRKLAEVLGCE